MDVVVSMLQQAQQPQAQPPENLDGIAFVEMRSKTFPEPVEGNNVEAVVSMLRQAQQPQAQAPGSLEWHCVC